MTVIEARGLRKAFGKTIALDGINLHVEEGRILGIIGPNGAGKSTALNAILGLTQYQGELKVLGREPWTERDQLMRDVCFISDIAVLPRWIRVSQALDYVGGVHPRFDRAKAESFLAKTDISRSSKVRELSKGMVTQLHLALVMAIDARLLVLDEPTLGLDLLYRKQFYDSLLNDYFDRNRTIVVTTHQVEDVQHVLTDLMFLNRGRILLDCSMEELESRYLEVAVRPEHLTAARALNPIHERQVLGRSILLFDLKFNHVDRQQLAALGDVRMPSIADLFVAMLDNKSANYIEQPQGAVPMNSSFEFHGRVFSDRRHRPVSATRPFYWSVRRELWENRSIYLAPLGVAAVFLVGLLFTTILPGTTLGLRSISPEHTATPYDIVAGLMMLTDDSGECVLLFRRFLWGTSRSQHPVLEVAAGIRSHNGARESQHPACDRAGNRMGQRCCRAMDRALIQLFKAAGERFERVRVVDRGVFLPHVAAAALPHFYSPHPLARAGLLLGTIGLRLDAPRNVAMGGAARGCHCRARRDCLPYLAFRRPGGWSVDWRCACSRLQIA